MKNPFDSDLDPVAANHLPLSPVGFLPHTATIFPDRTAVVHGDLRYSYQALLWRCESLARALLARGIGRGSTVSIIAPNVPAHLEAHFGVPMTGAVLNSINIRLDAATIAYIIDHGECDVLLVDAQFADVARDALRECARHPLVVDLDDTLGPKDIRIGALTYEQLLAEASPDTPIPPLQDEWQSLALNYTSGTTGNPKGVVYHHRGAYLNAIGNSFAWGMTPGPVYLWTLPMFHCNGWCFPWTITLQGGTHVCLRDVAAEPIIDSLARHAVTHMCGAPVVLSMLASAPQDLQQRIPAGLKIMTAGAAPPAAVIAGVEGLGAEITHTYGLTEVYGPCVYCAWHEEWNGKPLADRAALKARQGVPYPVLAGLDVLDPDTMQPVPADGTTLGEVMFRGNVVMKGYLKNPEATRDALAGGWFHSGDLAVKHPDNYIEVKDRSKDIIISGGENISSIEVEAALYKHPAVMAAAVVAKPDEKWGETPCAFIELKPGAEAPDPAVLTEFCREHLAGYKVPRHFVFGDLPKTSTGKIQKFLLRKAAGSL
ncbi:MAG: acyl-CoA synthetase [Halieaceae bacterium]|jgi:fatty-acyl-CoA synthase|nr:acyl-CoA synthetase [Halieaceae bacterium]